MNRKTWTVLLLGRTTTLRCAAAVTAMATLGAMAGEGREKLDHQMNISGEVKTAAGTFAGSAWFE